MSNKKGSVLMLSGLLMMLAALSLACYNLWEARRAEKTSAAVLERLEADIPEPLQSTDPDDPQEAVIPDYILNPDMDMPTMEIDGRKYIGYLTVPALGLELPVADEWSYSRLKTSPCRFEGTAYHNDMIIAGHNYRGHFGRLGNLRPGDEVRFTDGDGNAFAYTVTELLTLDGNDLDALEKGDWDLTLFTCTLGRKTRLVVRCAYAT